MSSFWDSESGERQPPLQRLLVALGVLLVALLVGIAVYGVVTSHDSPAVPPSPVGSATALADNPEGSTK